MKYLICRQTFLLVAQSRMSQYQLSIQSELHILSDCTNTHNPQKQQYDIFTWKDENTPCLELCFGPKRTKASGLTLHSCVT